jgi:hypothetical protein
MLHHTGALVYKRAQLADQGYLHRTRSSLVLPNFLQHSRQSPHLYSRETTMRPASTVTG